jgi:hypothetical protein
MTSFHHDALGWVGQLLCPAFLNCHNRLGAFTAYNGDFLQIQEGFNPEYIDGAGNVLRHIVIESSIQEGLKNYDFLGGFTEHKRRWKAEERFGHDLLIARPSLKTRLLFLKDIWPSGRYLSQYGLFDGND